MTDLEAGCRSAKCLGERTVAYCLCTLSGTVAASTGRQNLFIEEHCFGFPTAASDSAMRLLSAHKTIDSGRMVCNVQHTLFLAHGKTKCKRLAE